LINAGFSTGNPALCKDLPDVDITVFEGDENAVKAFILSNNIQRRHLSKAQKAILTAIAYPEPTPGKRTDLAQLYQLAHSNGDFQGCRRENASRINGARS
jgi:hypothetical protein